jgi:predicted ATPase
MRHLAKIAKENNIQLFVETHSEHIVNAVRLSILDDASTIDSTDVSIYFFDKDMSINELQIDSNAQIKNWPSGFFDQQQNDAEQILKLGLFK